LLGGQPVVALRGVEAVGLVVQGVAAVAVAREGCKFAVVPGADACGSSGACLS
jgi:hypothetical protein